MFWIIYLFAATLFSYLLAKPAKKNSFQLFVLLLITLITPNKIEASGFNYAPSVYVFFFNIFLEQNFSLRVLRPLVLSVPLGFLFLTIYTRIKRRFF